MQLTRAELEEVVTRNSKQRFSFDETGVLIRANQGHSVEVDLQLKPQTPPELLYHGTGHRTADTIEQAGLEKMRRHHVHLSPDVATATQVGSRHGRPVIFEVEAGGMHATAISSIAPPTASGSPIGCRRRIFAASGELRFAPAGA